jgi:L-ascorbate metabolism protein UlaG (beta-lactamase superfamily)
MAATTRLTWLGHAAFRVQVADQHPVILIDPWLKSPVVPPNADELTADVDLILITHAHSDHMDGTSDLAKKTGAKVVCVAEVGKELVVQGVRKDQVIAGNRGGAIEIDGITITLVQAVHTSSVDEPDGRARVVGEPCGLIIELPNGMVIYNSGDTGIFGDMMLLAQLYRPDIFMVCIGDFYTMGPRQAAMACKMVGAGTIIPQHYGTFPRLLGTPEALRALLPAEMRDRVRVLVPGVTAEIAR